MWAWLVLFSVIFFCVALLLFSGICYLRSFSLCLTATYATACTHILVDLVVVTSIWFRCKANLVNELVMPNTTHSTCCCFLGFTFLLCHILCWPHTTHTERERERDRNRQALFKRAHTFALSHSFGALTGRLRTMLPIIVQVCVCGSTECNLKPLSLCLSLTACVCVCVCKLRLAVRQAWLADGQTVGQTGTHDGSLRRGKKRNNCATQCWKKCDRNVYVYMYVWVCENVKISKQEIHFFMNYCVNFCMWMKITTTTVANYEWKRTWN